MTNIIFYLFVKEKYRIIINAFFIKLLQQVLKINKSKQKIYHLNSKFDNAKLTADLSIYLQPTKTKRPIEHPIFGNLQSILDFIVAEI